MIDRIRHRLWRFFHPRQARALDTAFAAFVSVMMKHEAKHAADFGQDDLSIKGWAQL